MKTVVVTGANRGIGRALVSALLARKQYRVIGTSTSGHAPFEQALFTCYPLSLEDPHSISSFVKHLIESNVEIFALVNNAAILLENANGEVDMSSLKKTFAVNVLGGIQLTESLIALMSSGSKILHMTSNWGSFSDPYFSPLQPHYKMSKASMNMYSKLLAERLVSKGIFVAAFDPGWVRTDMGGEEATKAPETVAEELLSILHETLPTGQFWRDGHTREW